jgi:hypothetical protein
MGIGAKPQNKALMAAALVIVGQYAGHCARTTDLLAIERWSE